MAKYKVELSSTAYKALNKLPRQNLIKILEVIEKLEQDPFPHGYKKLSGQDGVYRIRVGDYRIIYELHGKILLIIVLKIGHRKDIYK